MAKLDFTKLKCSAIIHCVNVDGEVEDLQGIKDELQNGIKSYLEDELIERNNVVFFELSDVVELDNGSDLSS